MKKVFLLITVFAAVVAVSSCQKQNKEEGQPLDQTGTEMPVLNGGQIYCVTPVNEEVLPASADETKTAWGTVYDTNKLDVVWLAWPISFVVGTVFPFFVYRRMIRTAADEEADHCEA